MNIMLCLPTFLVEVCTARCDQDSIAMKRSHIASFKEIIQRLEEQNHKVYAALAHNGWKLNDKMEPSAAVKMDWKKMDKADHVVACTVINEDASKGVHVEIGWATALNKPVTVLVQRPRTQQTIMVTALGGAGFKSRMLLYRDDPLECLDKLLERIETQQKYALRLVKGGQS